MARHNHAPATSDELLTTKKAPLEKFQPPFKMDKMLPCKLFSAENMWDAGLILRCHKKLSNAECVRCSRGANPKKISVRFACILQNNVQVREGTYLMDLRQKG